MLEEIGIPRLVVGGLGSGSGKTSISLGLTAALRARGRTVQTFKVGADFIDTAYLAHASRRPCRNLDSWLLGADGVRRSLAHGALGADCVIVEGAMGLLDGHGMVPEAPGERLTEFPGSTLEVARIIAAPVVLVIDAWATGETAAAAALGIKQLDGSGSVVGVILNNVPNDYRRRVIEDAVWSLARMPVLGAIPHIAVGPHPRTAHGTAAAPPEPACRRGHRGARRRGCPPLRPRPHRAPHGGCTPDTPTGTPPPTSAGQPSRFASASHSTTPSASTTRRTSSCSRMRARRSSPSRRSRMLPSRATSASSISAAASPRHSCRSSPANHPFLDSLRRARAHRVPVYAEGCGLQYLARSLRTSDGVTHQMAGLVPIDVALEAGTLHSGYRDLSIATASMLGPAGTRLRGHEFHFSHLLPGGDCLNPAYTMHDCDGEPLGCEGWTDPLDAGVLHPPPLRPGAGARGPPRRRRARVARPQSASGADGPRQPIRRPGVGLGCDVPGPVHDR